LRRSKHTRYAFASAVGKKNFSERISGTNKATIIEHHRAVQWSEKEYINLINVVRQNAALIRSDLNPGTVPHRAAADSTVDVRYLDYCGFLTPEPYIPEDQMRIRMMGGLN